MARVLFHVDLNAFFANAETLRHPEYKDIPMAVGSLSNRGVLSTANYPAREKGIHSAMPVFQARQMCPELVIVPGDYAYYRQLSGKFFQLLKSFTPYMEPVSIDECFLDVTEIIVKYPRPLDLAVQIQEAVLDQLGLQTSIGVGPTRFLAKMASDMRKPMGITVLRKSELAGKLWPLKIENMVGIGVKSVPLLQQAGIYTIGDLADPENEGKVLQILGRNGWGLIQKARGQSSDKLSYSTSQKSISMSRTYETDIYTLEETLTRARELTFALAQKLQKEGQKGALVSLVLRDTEFHNIMRSKTMPMWTDQFEVLYEQVQNLAAENFSPVGYRHIGVSVGSLKNGEKINEQPSIFEPQGQTAQDVVNLLNRKLDAPAFMKASDLLRKKDEDAS